MSETPTPVEPKTIEDVLAALDAQRSDLAQRIQAQQPKLSNTALDIVAIVTAAKDAHSIHIASPGAAPRNSYNETAGGWSIDISYGPPATPPIVATPHFRQSPEVDTQGLEES